MASYLPTCERQAYANELRGVVDGGSNEITRSLNFSDSYPQEFFPVRPIDISTSDLGWEFAVDINDGVLSNVGCEDGGGADCFKRLCQAKKNYLHNLFNYDNEIKLGVM